MVGKRTLLLLLVPAFLLTPLLAAVVPVVDMSLLGGVSYKPSTETVHQAMGMDLKISLPSPNSGNIRGEVVLKASYPDSSPTLEEVIHKAYLRARFPSFRLTAGKTRLSWGDGMLFNAGDVLYGSASTSVNLMQATLRETTGWMASLNYPLGFFSFAEAILIPSTTTRIEDVGFGFRFYTNVGETKVEAGYATTDASGRTHKPYVSLQGNIGPDWYLSSSVILDQELSASSSDFLVTGGLFHSLYFTGDRTMTLRLEFLSRPLESWAFKGQEDATCTLLLYPELAYSPSTSLSLSLRTILSPLDLSMNTTVSASWSVFEGFSLVGYLSAPFGQSSDLFNWEGTQMIALGIGASWIY
ncbi:MAG: hypothetical protein EOM32_01330 [Spirochaetia bacterium]|nr:hypothetical protein [Spirochaetia bacterium]NCC89376.1 hypothetical protein [Spirochaetia bacterium]